MYILRLFLLRYTVESYIKLYCNVITVKFSKNKHLIYLTF